jgi:hypothetical protein
MHEIFVLDAIPFTLLYELKELLAFNLGETQEFKAEIHDHR